MREQKIKTIGAGKRGRNAKWQLVLAGFLAAAMAVFGQPWAAAQDVTNQDVPALLKRIDELEKRLDAIEQNRAARTSAPTVPTVAGANDVQPSQGLPTVMLGVNGLVVRSADSNFVMDLHGYTQVDGRFYLGSKGTNVYDTFLLRRVRPIAEGSVWDNFDYRLMADFGSGNVTSSGANNVAILDDAYVNARLWPDLQIQVGKYKSPLGLERLQSTADLLFVETGFATQLTPNYDLGASLHNDYFNEPLGYSIGIYNGAADAASDDLGTTDEGKDLVGRLFASPFIRTDIAPLKRLAFGVGGSEGYHSGTLPGYKTPGQQPFFAYAPTVTANGQQYRIDPQAYYYWGPFGIEGEYVYSRQTVKSTGAGTPPRAELDNQAWQAELSYFLTGEENSFKASSLRHVIPLRRLDVVNGGWGALEVVARAQQLTIDPLAYHNYATATSAQAETAWGVGLNWYLNSNVKLNVDYEQTYFRSGSIAAGSSTARNEQAILSRVQVAF